MARVQIDLPKKFLFQTTIPVRADDINFARHLGNDRVAIMLQESRIQFFLWLGYNEENVERSSMIMADAALQYITEGFYGDKILFELSIQDFTRCGMDVVYKLTNLTRNRELARAKTALVFFNYDDRTIQEVPPAFREKVESLLAELA